MTCAALGGSEWAAAGISDTADITTLRLDRRHAFAVLATDGVWGPLDGTDGAADGAERGACMVAETLARASSRDATARAGDVAERLVAHAVRQDGPQADNASCCVVVFGVAEDS